MVKIDIFSGFLGAGKTTLIKKLIKEAYAGEKLVLIENEFGEIGVDGGFMQEAGITVNELNSGCICCSLVGDFAKALKQVDEQYHPDRILIEPSGVGKLSDVAKAVERAGLSDAKINSLTTVVDANKCKMYMKNFGEFFNDQIESAACIIFSHVDLVSEDKLQKAVELVRAHNDKATIVTTDLKKLDGKEILSAMEHTSTLADELAKLAQEVEGEHEHHHHHDDEDEHEHHHGHSDECGCGHDHEHHHHDDDEDEHEHHHEHGDECGCGHDHEHHHHHHADEVFTSWGTETSKKFTEEEIKSKLSALSDAVTYGVVLRAKGIVEGTDGQWLHFDYVPGEIDIRHGAPLYTGRLCVIGSKLDEEELQMLFAE
ncbi:MAG TPA: GTP-binding protein [Candidatus Coproplasma excrementipullorum]|nr:GTP-binding protein [Candidatus Coproplasma excrementipullorum]